MLIDSCLTLEILKQDSGLLPKPRENWNTFVPKKGDVAFVLLEQSYYGFTGTEWLIIDNYDSSKKYELKNEKWEEVKQEDEYNETSNGQ